MQKIFLYVLFFLLTAALGQANERFRPESAQDLLSKDTHHDVAYRILGAKLSWVNYRALRRDFPPLQKLSNDQIDGWILDNFAYVSESQLKLVGVRVTDIPVDRSQSKIIYRPEGYIRAGILEAVFDGKVTGLVDLKGIGITEVMDEEISHTVSWQVHQFEGVKNDPVRLNQLRDLDHSDGVMSSGEGVAEITRGEGIQRLFEAYNKEHGTGYETIENYFHMALPFSIIKSGGVLEPAGAVGRQAHWERMSHLNVPPEVYVDHFGMRQHDIFDAAIDFGGAIVTSPKAQDRYSQIFDSKSGNPQTSKPWGWGHDNARRFAAGDHDAIRNHIRYMLENLGPEDGPERDAIYLRSLLLSAKAWQGVRKPNSPGEELLKEIYLVYRSLEGRDFVPAEGSEVYVRPSEKFRTTAFFSLRNVTFMSRLLSHLDPSNYLSLAEAFTRTSKNHETEASGPEILVMLLPFIKNSPSSGFFDTVIPYAYSHPELFSKEIRMALLKDLFLIPADRARLFFNIAIADQDSQVVERAAMAIMEYNNLKMLEGSTLIKALPRIPEGKVRSEFITKIVARYGRERSVLEPLLDEYLKDIPSHVAAADALRAASWQNKVLFDIFAERFPTLNESEKLKILSLASTTQSRQTPGRREFFKLAVFDENPKISHGALVDYINDYKMAYKLELDNPKFDREKLLAMLRDDLSKPKGSPSPGCDRNLASLL